MDRFRLGLVFAFVAAGTLAVWTMPSALPRAGSVIATASMLEPRSGHSATLLPDGRVLIAGGMRRNQDFYRSAELYDPASGKFTRTNEMNVNRVGQAAVLLRSGKVLIAGGWTNNGTTDVAELFDPTTQRFTPITGMIARRARPSATLLPNGDVLFAGGADHDGAGGRLASAEIYRAATGSFQTTGSMHHARISHTATLLHDGRVLIIGGFGDSLTSSAEIYDPKSGTFSETGALLSARYKHTAGLLPDGRVLVAGGSDGRDWSGTMNSAEIFDPQTARFTAAAPLHDSRFKLPEEAVAVAGGQLLVVGGSKDVELYDPSSGRFLVAAGEVEAPLHFMTSTRLKDGRVLITGGYPNSDRSTSGAWIYRP